MSHHAVDAQRPNRDAIATDIGVYATDIGVYGLPTLSPEADAYLKRIYELRRE
jgi:hypothetical protein